MKKIFELFITFFKLGLFTFGGGYAMISLIQSECVDKKKWLTEEELLDIVAIAESTPGPIAINSATYIGHKIGGVLGSIMAVLGVVLPSFAIIYIISLFFDAFIQIEIIAKAFRGIQCAIGVIILTAGIKMLNKLPKSTLSIIIFSLTLIITIVLDVIAVNLSSIILILIAGVIGIVSTALTSTGKKRGDE
ncbi:MAG: chromate transporter [Clostridia bacterium]|nr:chromate transporter [Clostridia bacterium]